ncbi:hypothetical protein JKP10_03380 [Vibrio vulnificus]|uniref:hypothetical protein n=1 Tax=Vibrio vulnificus TaxID=672 RepID=UPI000928D4EF|nr:hypothetical protein [Vibrio vulnificus]EGR0088150.1 hypothetical protein [Vibrio vulnificus]EHU5197677.1 hypothetical protein [Vibrio vulnificus]EIO4075653.1 hypothetical protein [Vibrio vulnificus]EJR3609214.1 hypothetical protein [Vibrio vulnificus]EJV9306858.1 hypothetical protein [Vibrio vulnificus]
MAYIYAIWISTNAQEDVNKEFRKNGLKGEVISDAHGHIYICPQWSLYCQQHSQSEHLQCDIDPRWDEAIEVSLRFMQTRYLAYRMEDKPRWQAINSPFRCPKMKEHLECQDALVATDEECVQ